MRTLEVTYNSYIVIALLVVCVLLFASGPGWAAFPGQNGRIVFVANLTGTRQLYTIKADGSDMVQITSFSTQFEFGMLPSFSPDGRRIVFCHDTTATPNAPDLFVINSDGTGLTQLTNDGLSQAPRFSPDGTHIVFARQSTTGINVVTTMRADGTGPMTALVTDVWDSFGPSYTPDGKQIVFYSQDGGFVSAVWIMNIHGSKQRRLTPASLEGFPADVSPDGQSIVLINHGNLPLPTAIFTMDLNGMGLRQLTHPGEAHDLPGAYSPDGTKIVFASDRTSSDGSQDIFTMDTDGSGIKRITTGLSVTDPPAWGVKP